MDKKEALRVLNLIGVNGKGQAELRYLQLRARIEILITSAETEALKKMYLETSRSLDEAYHLLARRKEAKLLAAASVVGESWSDATEGSDSPEMLAQLKASLAEVQQMRTAMQQSSALLEEQLAKAEAITKTVERERETLEDATKAMEKLRSTAERNMIEISTHLKDARQLAAEIRGRKKELAQMAAMSNGKNRFLDAITGRAR